MQSSGLLYNIYELKTERLKNITTNSFMYIDIQSSGGRQFYIHIHETISSVFLVCPFLTRIYFSSVFTSSPLVLTDSLP